MFVCAWLSTCVHSGLRVNRAGGHHWQSPSPRMCLNTEGPLLMEGLSLCSPHLRVHTDLHRRPLHSVCWQDIQSHHTGTLFLSNTRVSGLFTPQIRVQAKRKNRRRSEGCVDGGNGIRIMDAWLNKTSGFFRQEYQSKLANLTLTALLFQQLHCLFLLWSTTQLHLYDRNFYIVAIVLQQKYFTSNVSVCSYIGWQCSDKSIGQE